MSEYTNLQAALHRAIGEKASPEVLYQITVAIHDRLVDAIEGHPTSASSLVKLAPVVLQSAASLAKMFGGHGADVAWREHRASLPLHRRLFAPSKTPEWFRRSWSHGQRKIGVDIVHQAFSEARS